MKNSHRPVEAIALLAGSILWLAACGSAGDGAALPPNDNPADTPAASGACLEGEPNCNDTGAFDTPAPLPADEGGIANPGAVADGGLSVSEALATDATGMIAVKGFLVVDETGAKLCETLAESYPPQCGSASVPVVDYEEMVGVPLQNAERVTWTDDPVSLFGELVDGVFVANPTATG